MKRLVGLLPKVNRRVFKTILFLLAKIADNEEATKMGPTNLSTVIGPNILYDREINPLTMVEDMENANAIIVLYINKCFEIFEIKSVIQATQEGDLPALKKLHSEGKSLEETDEDQLRAIHIAVMRTNLDFVEYLVNNNADVNALDAQGKPVRTLLF